MNWKKCAVACSLRLVTACSVLLVTVCIVELLREGFTERRRGGWHIDWQAQYGEKWPLTVPGGMFHCTYFMGKLQSVAFWYKGFDYHLLPLATYRQDSRDRPIDLIVKPDQKKPGKKMDTDLVLKEGLEWCKKGHRLT